MNFSDILELESLMPHEAKQKYGAHHINCLKVVSLVQDFVSSLEPEGMFFAFFLNHIRIHIVLAFFSTLRQHHTQAMMDLRQVFEAGAKAAFAIAFPKEKYFFQRHENGLIFEPKGLAKECYKWLLENYPKGSVSLRKLQDLINTSCAHANSVYVMQNFKKIKDGKLEFSFFDGEDAFRIKSDLFFISNVARGLMDLFYGVNKGRNIISFSQDFLKRMKEYGQTEDKLKKEIMKSKRFKGGKGLSS